jgi:hypothetical protein
MAFFQKLAVLTIVIAGLAAPVFGAGCDGKPVQFEDKFTDLKNWPDIPKELSPSVNGGRLTLTVAKDQSWTFLYHGDVFDDADYCVTFKLVKSTNSTVDKNSAVFSVSFWAKDYSNKYRLAISPEIKTFNVDRLVANRWIGTSTWQQSPTIKGVGEENLIRVSMRAGQAKYYINDQEVVPDSPLAAHPPEGGGQIGFGVSAIADTQYVWEVASLKITK